VDEASQSNYKKAQKIAKKPYEEYEGQRVADQSGMTTAGYDWLMKNVGATSSLYDQSAALNNRITEQDPLYAEANQMFRTSYGNQDLDKYLNPYTAEVEQNAIRSATDSLTGSMNLAEDEAKKAGAFGSSLGAVQQGVLAAEGAKGIGDLSAELRQKGYDTATANMIAEQQLQQQAATGILSSAGQQGTGWQNAATGLLNTAAGQENMVNTSFGNMMMAGQQEQAYNQSKIDADMAKWQEKSNYDVEKLNLLLSSLGMSPYGKTETTDKEVTEPAAPIDWSTIALGGLKMLPALGGLSDRRDKKDIQKLGEDEKTGLPVYAYRYKDAKASDPKVVGVMAQDVEKKYPRAVSEIGGHKVINYGILASG
jgi:hypothetical protein